MDKNVYWQCPVCGGRVLLWPVEDDSDAELVVECHEFFTHGIGEQPVMEGCDY